MKKQILTALAVLASLCGQAQSTDYNLTVKLGVLKTPAKAYLVSSYGWTNQNVLDSAVAQDGTFTFRGKVDEPQKLHLIIIRDGQNIKTFDKNADALIIYLEPGRIQVLGADSVKNARITGSDLNAEYARYRAAVLLTGEKANSAANAEYLAASEDKKKDKLFINNLMAKIKKASKDMDSLKYIYIKQNPDSYLSLAALIELAADNMDIARIQPLFKGLSPRLQATKTGVKFANKLYDRGPLSPGTMAPNFTQNDVDGKPVSLADFRGKYVLVDFWASWCGPCRAENPNLVKAYDKYKSKNFTILGISLDQPDKKEAWLAAIKKDGLSWTQVSDLKFWNNAVAKLYEIRAIPQNFLIDPTGKIIAKNLRGDALNEKLAALFK